MYEQCSGNLLLPTEDPKMVKQIVSGCPEENKSEMKSNQVQPCCNLLFVSPILERNSTWS